MLRHLFQLQEGLAFLNHGSFGAVPRAVSAHQEHWRHRMEQDPVAFMTRTLPDALEGVRGAVASFMGARPEDVVLVRNATAGVNGVLRSLTLQPGDELLCTDHGYNACRNVLDHVASRSGARVVVARVPFPLQSAEQVVEGVMSAVTARTTLALVDHITSPTGLVFPLEALVRRLRERGVRVLVDGAHAPGQVPVDLSALGATWYTANFHKWTCAPRGAAMLWVHPDHQKDLHPAVISHGYNSRSSRPRWLEEFDWTGTEDPTPWLCIPHALDFVGRLLPCGWDAVRTHNRELTLRARDALCALLGQAPPAPDSMVGAMAAVALPDATGPAPVSSLYVDPLQDVLLQNHRVQVPLPPWPAHPRRLLRVSSHVHTSWEDHQRLVSALRQELRL